MTRIALYRKYRPRRFEDILGQSHVTQTLKNAIADSNASHAYIFTGPRGVGKTSAARLFATSINCEKNNNGEPCSKCDICKSILENKAVDIIEIDAASNRGIDEIRELKENVRFAPNRFRYKVFIIDEVHMLTKEAFNALLKTLEEPPSHVMFVLATTEIHKVPQTILSRSQRFDFKRIKLEDLLKQLQEIAKKEGIKINKEALSLIAESSEGGFRDAISCLDQISNYKNSEITEEDVVDLLGMSDYHSLIDFVRLVKSSKIKESIDLVNELAEKGVDSSQFTKNIIEFLRKMMLTKITGGSKIDLTGEHLDELKELADKFETNEISEMIEVIITYSNNFKNAPLPQMPLELAIVDIIGGNKVAGGSSEKGIEKGEKQVEIKQEIKPKEKIEEKRALRNTQKANFDLKKKDIDSSNTDEEEHWPDFLLELKGRSPSVQALIRKSEHEFNEGTLKLTFPFRFYRDRIDDKKNKKVVEDTLKRVYNKSYKVRYVTKGVSENKRTGGKKSKELIDNVVNIFEGEIVN